MSTTDDNAPSQPSPVQQMIGGVAPKLVELYSGWPTAMSAIVIAKNLFE